MSEYLDIMRSIINESVSQELIERKLKACVELSKKIADSSYAYDHDGQEEFKIDCQDLKNVLEDVYADYLVNKERKGKAE